MWTFAREYPVSSSNSRIAHRTSDSHCIFLPFGNDHSCSSALSVTRLTSSRIPPAPHDVTSRVYVLRAPWNAPSHEQFGSLFHDPQKLFHSSGNGVLAMRSFSSLVIDAMSLQTYLRFA